MPLDNSSYLEALCFGTPRSVVGKAIYHLVDVISVLNYTVGIESKPTFDTFQRFYVSIDRSVRETEPKTFWGKGGVFQIEPSFGPLFQEPLTLFPSFIPSSQYQTNRTNEVLHSLSIPLKLCI
jgi:hypothetical protein